MRLISTPTPWRRRQNLLPKHHASFAQQKWSNRQIQSVSFPTWPTGGGSTPHSVFITLPKRYYHCDRLSISRQRSSVLPDKRRMAQRWQSVGRSLMVNQGGKKTPYMYRLKKEYTFLWWRRVVSYIGTNVSEESIYRTTRRHGPQDKIFIFIDITKTYLTKYGSMSKNTETWWRSTKRCHRYCRLGDQLH